MTHLKKGDQAPPINKTASNGEQINWDALRGQRIILYFYPKDNTPGCTSEACNLRDNYEALFDRGFAILGVSPDSDESHRKFIAKYDLPFPLIADPERKFCMLTAFGAKKKCMENLTMGCTGPRLSLINKDVLRKSLKK